MEKEEKPCDERVNFVHEIACGCYQFLLQLKLEQQTSRGVNNHLLISKGMAHLLISKGMAWVMNEQWLGG